MWHNNENLCMCVCVCIYIYIYIYMGMCVGLNVLWVARGILSSVSLTSVKVSGRSPLFVYFGMKTCPCVNCETERKRQSTLGSCEWDSRAESQRFRREVRGWSVSSKTWIQSKWKAVWSQEWRHRAVKMMTRWVSIFGSCVGFSLSSCNSHISCTEECLKRA